MPQFGGDARAAQKYSPADHQRAADAAADVRIEHDAGPASRAEAGLAQPGHIRIVRHASRHAERIAAPIGQRKAVPAVDLMALDDPTTSRIDRPAEAKPDDPHVVLVDQWRGDLSNLSPNAFRAARRDDTVRVLRDWLAGQQVSGLVNESRDFGRQFNPMRALRLAGALMADVEAARIALGDMPAESHPRSNPEVWGAWVYAFPDRDLYALPRK